MSPAKLQSLLQNGLAHHRAGRLAEAELAYRQARVGAPKNFDVLHLSGLVAYQQGKIVEAVQWLGRAHELDRRNAVCEMRYALALLGARRAPEAEKHLRHAVETKPDMHEGWDNLAYCLKLQDRLGDALGCHEKAVALKPDYAVGWYNFGLTLSTLGRHAEALACHDRALLADPGYALACYGRAQVLHKTHRIAEAVAEYGAFIALRPKHLEARSHRLMALHNLPGVAREALHAEHVAYGQAVEATATPELPNSPDAARRLRLAILSPDLREHSCAYFLEPLLEHLDGERFEIYLYHDHFREDAVSARLKSLAAVWRNFAGQPGPAVEAAIRADAPDILIDLAGHTGMSSRLPLFARRLAPVQATYLGYPNTTGLAAMDVRLTDGVADPAGEAEAFATERLVRFAPCAWTFRPSAVTPEVAPSPQAASGRVTFGCFNTLGKITDDTLACWARLLAAVPASRLLLKGAGLGEPGERARFAARLEAAGFRKGEVELLERTPDTAAHLALYGRIDIALDTWPYHGTTTTCEALWMGVPVISLAGDRHVSRVGTSLLTAIGRTEWVAYSENDYVAAAAALASDGARLAELRAGLREEMRRSVLCDYAGQAGRFGAALRECWVEWCAKSELALA
ncbi:MAG: hypothetical protein V4773_28620 [Verrucomicrobiota bacterium]